MSVIRITPIAVGPIIPLEVVFLWCQIYRYGSLTKLGKSDRNSKFAILERLALAAYSFTTGNYVITKTML